MPNQTVTNYLCEKTGIDFERFSTQQNVRNLCNNAGLRGESLSNSLYCAVVKLDGDQILQGGGLTPSQLVCFKNLALKASQQPSCSEEGEKTLRNFAGAAERYNDFYTTSYGMDNDVDNVINKQERLALQKAGTTSTPRHTIMRRGNEVYEILTWMTKDEIHRLQSRFANTQGLFSIVAEKSRTREWGGEPLTECKVTLGSGAFGSARIARRVSDDQYMVFKKIHPNDNGPKPAPTPILKAVNDGRSSGVSKVYDSFFAVSTRDGGDIHPENSAYTLTEIGVIDTQKFTTLFSVMSYAFNSDYLNQPLAKVLNLEIIQNSGSAEQALVNISRIASSPCGDADHVRRFKNTMAYQMLQSVKQMHQHDRAHNDIKPDNFVLAYDNNNQLRVKLIDFDLSKSVSKTVGQARDVYVRAFTAPQASKNEINNNPACNDAFSMGCTFKLMNGEPIDSLVLQSMLLRNEIVSANGKSIKPVEDRRTIEARFKNIPELTTLNDLSNLLCHPHMKKRYTIEQALQSPLFKHADNMLSEQQFSEMAEKIVRHGHMIPTETVKNLDGIQNLVNRVEANIRGNQPSFFGPLSEALFKQDINLLTRKYVKTHGEQKLTEQLRKAKKEEQAGNASAVLRRGVRQLNINHHLKSKAEKEATYTYKSYK